MKRMLSIFAAAFIAGSLFAQSITCRSAKTGGLPLMEALAKRSTARAFDQGAFASANLQSSLAAFGINRPTAAHRASAMNFQETTSMCCSNGAAYVYSAKSNQLDLVVAEDIALWVEPRLS